MPLYPEGSVKYTKSRRNIQQQMQIKFEEGIKGFKLFLNRVIITVLKVIFLKNRNISLYSHYM